MKSIFATKKISTTHVYQNHLDKLHEDLDSFCRQHKGYTWKLTEGNSKTVGLNKVEDYLARHKPRKLSYKVTDLADSMELQVGIDDGVLVNLKNGNFDLYGLYSLIIDNLNELKIPKSISFVRRHWLISLLVSAWVLPIMLFYFFHQSGWAVAWLILFPFIVLFGGAAIMDSAGWDPEWDDITLRTKISYGVYNEKLGSPFYLLLTSTKTIVSFLAALATVVSTVIILMRKN